MLYVSECFGPTEQGEGKTAGKEVMFLRLAYCNLKCVFCDTPYTWQAKLLKTEVHKMTIEDVITKLQNRKVIKSIVISGGEPLLQQKELISLCKWLRSTNWWIEIETNGTILPNKELVNLVNQFNCSPKLSNSGNIKPQNPKALNFFSKNEKSNFKFVVSKHKDIFEIVELVLKYKIFKDDIYLMPEGRFPNELDKTRGIAKEICKATGFNFTDRLHVVKYGGVRGK